MPSRVASLALATAIILGGCGSVASCAGSATPVASGEKLVATYTAVWVTNNHGGPVSRIDPATNEVVALR